MRHWLTGQATHARAYINVEARVLLAEDALPHEATPVRVEERYEFVSAAEQLHQFRYPPPPTRFGIFSRARRSRIRPRRASEQCALPRRLWRRRRRPCRAVEYVHCERRTRLRRQAALLRRRCIAGRFRNAVTVSDFRVHTQSAATNH